MDSREWKTVSSEYIHQHPPFFSARKDVCVRPDGVSIPAYYVVEVAASVITFGVTSANEVIMIEQYRHPVKSLSLELPGGFIDEKEQPVEAAEREMLEETGYRFSRFEYLGKLAGNPGILDNYTYIFLATGGEPGEVTNPDLQEDIRTRLVSFATLKKLMRDNQVIQSLHLNACFYGLLKLGEIELLKEK